MRYRLSIVMPMHNEGDEPYKTIDSIRRSVSNWRDIEIVVIDDCSDKFCSIGRYKNFPNVKLYRNASRLGVHYSIDKGVKLSNSRDIVIIGSHMRFKTLDWDNRVVELLELDSNALYCAVCLSDKSDSERYGASIVVFDYRHTFEAKWIGESPSASIQEVPCVLGAHYWCRKSLYKRVRGLSGLRIWGSLEPYLSTKVWLSGGSCKVVKDVKTSHLFRAKSPRESYPEYTIYNKLYCCETILGSVGQEILKKFDRDSVEISKAFEIMDRNRRVIQRAKRYYNGIFRYDFKDFMRKFQLFYIPKRVDIEEVIRRGLARAI